MPARLQVRHGTAAQWTAANPVLLNGEPGAETDTSKWKVGNGTTAWNSLSYVGGGSGTVTTTGSPASGELVAFSGATSITTGNLSGAVTTSGTLATTLSNDAVTTAKILDANVTLAKMADLAADRLIGRGNGGGTGVPQALSLGTNLSLSGTTLNVTAGGGTSGLDARSSIYPPFTPSGVDTEFTGSDLAGYTLVNDGGGTLATNTESNDMLSIKLPGNDVSGRLQAYMKAATCNTGDIIECCINGAGLVANFHNFGLLFANGATYGAGAQVVWAFFPNGGTQTMQLFANTNYNTQGTNTAVNGSANSQGARFMRLKYEAANSFSGWISPDGISWANITGSLSRTLTPTHVGFCAQTGGAAGQFVWNVRYFRKTT